MIIDFKFDYEVEVILHGGRKAKKMFTESQMSVNVKSITRDDVRTVALLKRDKSFNQFRNANLTGGFIIDYLEYEGVLYTPVTHHNKELPRKYERVFNDDNSIIVNDSYEKLKGLSVDDIQNVQDFYDLNNIPDNQRLDPDKIVKTYYSDNRLFVENRIEKILDDHIFIDGELYRKSIGPVFLMENDVEFAIKPNNNFEYYNRYEKKYCAKNIRNYELTSLIDEVPENLISGIENSYDGFSISSYYISKNNGIFLTPDMLNFYLNNEHINGYAQPRNIDFQIFDMEFLINQNSPHYAKILFNQIMDFDKTFVKNTPENFEQYFLMLKEKYPFGDELYFLIKNCQEDTNLNNLSALSSFVCENFKKFKKMPSIYKENINQNNLHYPSDYDFFSPFIRINSFLENYFEYQNMNSEDYINVKKGESSFNIKIETPQLRFR